MHQTLAILIISALSVGFVHTLLGPDHYLPFIVMAKARKWSALKTATITTLCGIGHVLSAVILGLVAIAIGLTLTKLNFIENFRGAIAAWLLIGFGFAYFLWGLRQAIKNKKHSHIHFHQDGSIHDHTHNHHEEHAHLHPTKSIKELAPWILFIIFILGPCEPLIPLIMYPAVRGMNLEVILITLFFGAATLLVMLTMVFASVYGTRLIHYPFFEKYGNAMAGAIICSSGLAIKFLGI
jgi:nickel/cobalt transporter (NicO) family protein